MNVVTNHAIGAGSIDRPIDQQSSALPLYYGCPLTCHGEVGIVLMMSQEHVPFEFFIAEKLV